MLRLLIFIMIVFKVHSVSAESASESLLSKLSEAKDYLRIQPSVSSRILKKNLPNIGQLTINEQLSWHQNLLRASIALNDLNQVEQTIKVMLSYPEIEKKTDKFVSLLSSLGIFLRRTGYPHESILLFNCGLEQPIKNEKQRISLLISKGSSLSSLNQYSQAKATYAQALQLAKQQNAEVLISATYNTLGIMSLKEGDYRLAKEYLINALQLSQNISRRSGQIVAGLQLLRLSILNNEPMLYDRLHYRISRLTLVSESEVRHAYLFWIEKAHKVSKGNKLSAQEQDELLNKINQIKPISVSLYNQLVETLAEPMGISTLAVIAESNVYHGDLLKGIHHCKNIE